MNGFSEFNSLSQQLYTFPDIIIKIAQCKVMPHQNRKLSFGLTLKTTNNQNRNPMPPIYYVTLVALVIAEIQISEQIFNGQLAHYCKPTVELFRTLFIWEIPISLRVTLKYRKSDRNFLNFIFYRWYHDKDTGRLCRSYQRSKMVAQSSIWI